MICCSIGMAGEFVTAFKGGKFVLMGNTQVFRFMSETRTTLLMMVKFSTWQCFSSLASMV